MLIIANQVPVRICGQGRLARSAEPKEECHVPITFRLIRRGVQGQLTEFDGLEVVHDTEDTLLHLAGVLGTKDDHLHPLEIDPDGSARRHTRSEAVGGELAGVVDDEVWFSECFQFLRRRTDEHVVLRYSQHETDDDRMTRAPNRKLKAHHKQGMICPRGDNPDLNPVFRVPTRKPVENIDVLPRIEVINCPLAVDLEGVFTDPISSGQGPTDDAKDSLHLDVHRSPPDLILARLLEHNPLVLWGPTSLLS